MDHANAAADILPGSVWESLGVRVKVLSTAAGYVRYRQDVGLGLQHHAAFRRAFRPIYDRRAVKSQFSMSCANLDQFHAYWLPSAKTLVARSIACRRRFRVPPGAIHVGTYANPCSADAFLDDLDCVLATLEADATRSASAA